MEVEDCEAEGYIGLLGALRAWDEKKGDNRENFLAWWIKQRVMNALRGKQRESNSEILDLDLGPHAC